MCLNRGRAALWKITVTDSQAANDLAYNHLLPAFYNRCTVCTILYVNMCMYSTCEHLNLNLFFKSVCTLSFLFLIFYPWLWMMSWPFRLPQILSESVQTLFQNMLIHLGMCRMTCFTIITEFSFFITGMFIHSCAVVKNHLIKTKHKYCYIKLKDCRSFWRKEVYYELKWSLPPGCPVL